MTILISGCVPKWQSVLVSSNGEGADSGNDESGLVVPPYNESVRSDHVFSPDGTKLAFSSRASDLDATAQDTAGRRDVFVRDLTTGTTRLVSVNAAGTASGNGESSQPAFSPDGTRIAFTSTATDLGTLDADAQPDVFVRDLTTGTTSLVSVNAAGTASGNFEARQPRFNFDGSRVAFLSKSTDLGATDTDACWRDRWPLPAVQGPCDDVYARDLDAGTTALLSGDAAGVSSDQLDAVMGAFSPVDDRYAFTSEASLAPIDHNGVLDVYVRDLSSGAVTLVSVNAAGDDGGDRGSSTPAFSPDGGRVAFVSSATDLGPPDTVHRNDMFVRDLRAGTTELVTAPTPAAPPSDGDREMALPTFSADGTKLVFASNATDLVTTELERPVTGCPPDWSALFVRDLVTGTVTFVADAGVHPGGTACVGMLEPSINAAGDKVSFTSHWDLLAGDTNQASDVYVRDLDTDKLSIVSAHGGRAGNGPSSSGVFDPTGDTVAFASTADDLGPNDTNDKVDIYLADPRGR